MRTSFVKALEKCYLSTPFTFLTGDLGFQAFEPLQTLMGKRFINAGIAEQNMMSVAAGLAMENEQVWVYSIAPFCYARPFEQVRNDICYHRLPIKLVGNGGGYAYGPMGFTHHALEDYGILLTLPLMRVYIPAFNSDVSTIAEHLASSNHPSYLRLGKCELKDTTKAPPYQPWRKLLDGSQSTLLAIGPLAGLYFEYFSHMPENERPELWTLCELPLQLATVPEAFLHSCQSQGLTVCEEHVIQGGVGQSLAYLILSLGVTLPFFKHNFADGYQTGTVGSQTFHRKQSHLLAEDIVYQLNSFAIR